MCRFKPILFSLCFLAPTADAAGEPAHGWVPEHFQTESIRKIKNQLSWPPGVPDRLKVETLICVGVRMPVIGTFLQLPPGGEWQKLDENSFLYSGVSVDPVTGRRNDTRYLFVQTDLPYGCGKHNSCATIGRIVFNGRDLSQHEIGQVCGLMAINAAQQGAGTR